ncbi:MAG TPA: wax ester/triacylglycerol synthase family O-acyltransferase, partial [Solirubrobacteraceae bacterium]|nr:wax ester/triacylglycerol synthase family O-acyltransferase [Solirubrobacteraceae bacterium]
RLTAVDASFLHQEGPTSHMHIGGLTIFEGPPPAMADLLEQIRQRLHLVPRYRHKLASTAFDSGRPVWVDDPNFNLEYHIRHTALPTPGRWEQLCSLTARIFSQQLDRSKPLWEMWLIEGLEDDRFALITKTHHSLVDGIAGVDLATVLFDLSPDPPPIRHSGRPWQPHREPGTVELVAAGIRGAARAAFALADGAVDALAHPERALARAREAAEGIGEIVWAGLDPAPETPLNVPIGPHRRFFGIQCSLDDFKTVKNAFGGTVNDVVLAVVSGAMRSWLISRGQRTEGIELRALVPVSVRVEDEHGEGGNRLVVMRGPLPVYIADPVQRLHFVSQAMDGLKESKQALGAEVIAGAQNFAPPTLLAQASRLNFSTRLFNLIVTNIPGPQFPLYVLGREMLEAYPVAFLPENHALAIAIMSYNQQMNFGLLGDFDALPDIDEISASISDELQKLLALARKPVAATA